MPNLWRTEPRMVQSCARVGSAPVMEGIVVTRSAEDSWSRVSLFETDVPALKNAVEPKRFRF